MSAWRKVNVNVEEFCQVRLCWGGRVSLLALQEFRPLPGSSIFLLVFSLLFKISFFLWCVYDSHLFLCLFLMCCLFSNSMVPFWLHSYSTFRILGWKLWFEDCHYFIVCWHLLLLMRNLPPNDQPFVGLSSLIAFTIFFSRLTFFGFHPIWLG